MVDNVSDCDTEQLDISMEIQSDSSEFSCDSSCTDIKTLVQNINENPVEVIFEEEEQPQEYVLSFADEEEEKEEDEDIEEINTSDYEDANNAETVENGVKIFMIRTIAVNNFIPVMQQPLAIEEEEKEEEKDMSVNIVEINVLVGKKWRSEGDILDYMEPTTLEDLQQLIYERSHHTEYEVINDGFCDMLFSDGYGSSDNEIEYDSETDSESDCELEQGVEFPSDNSSDFSDSADSDEILERVSQEDETEALSDSMLPFSELYPDTEEEVLRRYIDASSFDGSDSDVLERVP